VAMSRETSQQPEHSREGSSKNKSQENAPMDVSDDGQDEAIQKLNKDKL
jgi:hypothetical protein